MMEQILLETMLRHMDNKEVIGDSQHGFIKGKSCLINLVMQVGGDEIAERSPKAIKRDFRALGRLVEGSGVQVVFSSIPSVTGNSTERGRKTHLVNRWLSNWCHQSNIGFFDHGEVYTAPELLMTGSSQLSQRGKRILGHELAGLIERALN